MKSASKNDQRPASTRNIKPGLGAMWAVTVELMRAFAQILVLPFSAVGFCMRRSRLCLEVACDLDEKAKVEEVAELHVPLDRPLHLFISSAEASGETHAVSLVRALRHELAELGAPPPLLSGLGGERLAAEGVTIVGNPVARAAMGADVLGALPFYLGLLADTAQHFRDVHPDAVIPVDSPALHVPLGRIAKRTSSPVVHFVAPQYWAWAPWRTGGYRKAVDMTLTILPFERAWFRRRRIDARYVGHPLLDALKDVPSGKPSANGPLVLLPGSRESVIDRNLPWMLNVVKNLVLTIDEPLEVVLPHADKKLTAKLEEHLERAGARELVTLKTGDLHATLSTARAALSVSGTVLIDLLHHRLPCVVIYRMSSAFAAGPGRKLLTVPYFSSLNLLAGRRVVPEYAFFGRGPSDEVVRDLMRALGPSDWRNSCLHGLDRVAERLGPAGSARRAARQVLSVVRST